MDLWHVISHVWTYYCTAERSVPDRFLNLFCRIYFLLRWYLFHQFVSSFCDFAILPSVTFLGDAESRFRKTSRNDQTNSHTSKHKPLEWKQMEKLIWCTMWSLLHKYEIQTWKVCDVWCTSHLMYLLFLRALFSFKWSIFGTGKLKLSAL